MALPSHLAEIYFSPRWRTTATAIAVESATFGTAMAYLVPLTLHENSLEGGPTRSLRVSTHGIRITPTPSHTDLNSLNAFCVALVAVLLLCCIYIPQGPSVAPSKSAALDLREEGKSVLSPRADAPEADGGAFAVSGASHAPGADSANAAFEETYAAPRPVLAPLAHRSKWHDLQSLASSPPFLVVLVAYGVVTGFSGAWSSTLAINLSRIGLSEQYAGLIGFSGMLAGVVASLLVARAAEGAKSIKTVLVGLNVANVIVLAIFATVVQPVAELAPATSLALVWVTAVLSSVAAFATAPLFFELLVETAFPASSSLVLLASVFANNAANLGLLFVPISTAAIGFNWGYFGGCAAVTLLLAFGYRERLGRRQFDEGRGDVALTGAPLEKREGFDGGPATSSAVDAFVDGYCSVGPTGSGARRTPESVALRLLSRAPEAASGDCATMLSAPSPHLPSGPPTSPLLIRVPSGTSLSRHASS